MRMGKSEGGRVNGLTATETLDMTSVMALSPRGPFAPRPWRAGRLWSQSLSSSGLRTGVLQGGLSGDLPGTPVRAGGSGQLCFLFLSSEGGGELPRAVH